MKIMRFSTSGSIGILAVTSGSRTNQGRNRMLFFIGISAELALSLLDPPESFAFFPIALWVKLSTTKSSLIYKMAVESPISVIRGGEVVPSLLHSSK